MARIPTLIESPERDGRIVAVNRARLNEIPYWFLTNQPNNQVTVPANQASTMQIMTLSGEGPMRLISWGHQKTAAMRVFLRVQDGETPRGLMNGSCHIDTIFGNGQQPFFLPEALYLDELRSMQATFTDISGAPNAVRISMLGSKFLTQQVDPTTERIRKRLESRQYISMPYFYTLDEATPDQGGGFQIPAGATVQSTITVGQDHHFQIFTLSAVSTDPRFDIDILDISRGESIVQAPSDSHYPIQAELLLGTGNFPFRFHEPRLIQVGQKLLVTLTDRSGAPNTVNLTLGGRALALRMWR